jgi:hypothetical protein
MERFRVYTRCTIDEDFEMSGIWECLGKACFTIKIHGDVHLRRPIKEILWEKIKTDHSVVTGGRMNEMNIKACAIGYARKRNAKGQ